MAEKKKQKKPRQVKDAGERVVLVGLPAEPMWLAEALVSMREPDFVDAEVTKAAKELVKSLPVEDGKVMVWANLGQIEAGGIKAAVNGLVGIDVPGAFRAPPAAGWREQLNRKRPAQIALVDEITD